MQPVGGACVTSPAQVNSCATKLQRRKWTRQDLIVESSVLYNMFGLLSLCLLLRTGLTLDCNWDPSVDQNQGLKPTSLTAGARLLGEWSSVSTADDCRAACCAHADCDLALVGSPMDAGLQCQLVDCTSRGHDVCAFKASSQFQVFRRARAVAREDGRSGNAPRIVPLMGGSWEPRINSTDRCRLPMKVGPCRAAFPKFFYNVSSQTCSGFTYGGCDANANNFDSAQECEAACSGVTGSVLPDDSSPAPAVKAPRMAPADPPADPAGPADPAPLQRTEMFADEFAERCEAEPKVGPCRAALKHWYYNKDDDSCQSFIYGGCRGNKNNYLTEDSCKETCTGVTVLPSPKKAKVEDQGPAGIPDHCRLKPDTGNCRAAFPKFYYDSGSASCLTFLYGGCQGNANNFDSEEACLRSCSGDAWHDLHKIRSRWTAASFLFTTLAVISVLVLVALVVCMLKRRGTYRSARPRSYSDKDELIPNEQSSVDSLTLPDSPGPGLKA